ncbi:hypothetical protein BS78_05G101800 [Paspalum vaginatum]|nr:hypothetical protein BS78_05G101800 [Paspalum vaginatum]
MADQLHFTSFVVGWNETRKCARILTSSENIIGFDTKPMLQVCLPNKSILEGKLFCIAGPINGLRLRTVELLDVSLEEKLSRDHNINNGYIVYEVSVGSTTERLGVRSGEVIISFDGQHDYTLPQAKQILLEDHFLSLGERFLQSDDSSFMVDVELEVYDLLGDRARTIILPIGFSVAPEPEEEEEEEDGDDEEEKSHT